MPFCGMGNGIAAEAASHKVPASRLALVGGAFKPDAFRHVQTLGIASKTERAARDEACSYKLANDGG